MKNYYRVAPWSPVSRENRYNLVKVFIIKQNGYKFRVNHIFLSLQFLPHETRLRKFRDRVPSLLSRVLRLLFRSKLRFLQSSELFIYETHR